MLESTLNKTVHLSAASNAGSKLSTIFFKLCRVCDLEILGGTLRGLNNLLSFSGVDISACGCGP